MIERMAKDVKRSVNYTLLITSKKGRRTPNGKMTHRMRKVNMLTIAENDSTRRKNKGLKGELRWSITMIYHGSDNDSHHGQNDNMGDLKDMHVNIVQTTGAIWITLTIGREVFHVTGTMLRLLKLRGMSRGQPDVPKWAKEFYEAYAKALPKKRKSTIWKPLEEVEIRGNKVPCDAGTINTVLGTKIISTERFWVRMKFKLDSHKEWLAQLILDSSPPCNIRRIEAEYLWDYADWKKPPPQNTAPVVDPAILASKANTTAPSVDQSSIFSSSVGPSSGATHVSPTIDAVGAVPTLTPTSRHL
uniref:Uncharacterized protein n=1 Tax=Solanum tuberosum TaxID=4113 RepID=M1DAA8_SOLTU